MGFLSQYFVPITVGLFAVSLAIWFIISYARKALLLTRNLEAATDSIRNIKNRDPNSIKHELSTILNALPLSHAWSMYEATLHEQTDVVDGEVCIVQIRATAPSEAFFSQQYIVDTPIQSEFFKHLPGIITGIGIIGTFGGLLWGLGKFDPSGDPAKVQDSLALLLNGVKDAFIGSGIAITVAMLVTGFEKLYLKNCYAALEKLTSTLDGLFEAGLGEEYLEQLVRSSKDSATQTKQLKDSLVTDLKEMLANLVAENQRSQLELANTLTRSYQENGDNMAAKIGQSISDSFKEPLEQIAAGVGKVSGDQGAAVQGLLQDVLVAFMNKLESTFGNQMSGMSDMLAQSATAMKEMQLGISNLIADMRNSSEASSKAIEGQMLTLMAEIQTKQQEMGSTMANMLEAVRENVAQIGNSGSEAANQMNMKMAELVAGISIQISGLMNSLEEKRKEHDRAAARSQEELHTRTRGMVEGLGEQVSRLLEETQQSMTMTRQQLDSITRLSTDSIKGMNEGADKIRIAADRFTNAGTALTIVTEKSTNLVSEVNTLSGNMINASSQLKTLLADYQQSRDALAKSIQAIEGLIQSARSEAGMTTQIINDMKAMTLSLEKVRGETQAYLGQVSLVLGKGFDDFSGSVERSLNKTLGIFDNTLERAVQHLRGGVEALGEVAEEIADQTKRAARK